jgi:vitamin B12 transporter
MIDGVEISDPSGTQGGPQIQHLSSANDISRVEILRGPQGFIYGADAGGVINIITKESDEVFEAEIGGETGKYNSNSFEGYVAGNASKVNYFLSVNKQKTDGFNARVSDTTNDSDGYKNVTSHGKLKLDLTDALSLQLVGRSVDADTEFDNCGYFDADFNFISTNICDGDFRQDILKSTLSYENEDATQQIAYEYTDVERKNLANGNLSFQTEGDIKKVEYLSSYTVNESFKVLAGADSKKEAIESANTVADRNQFGVFTELQSQFNELTISVGARYDDNEDFGTHTSIRSSAAYVVDLADNQLKLRASYGNGFRAPSLSEIAYNQSPSAFGDAANTILEEEQSSGFDIGAEFYTERGASYKLSLFKQKVENEIFFDLVGFSGYLQSGSDSESEGIELELEEPLGEYFKISSNLTYNETKGNDEQPRIRRPRLLLNLGFEAMLLEQDLTLLANVRLSRDSENQVFGVGRVELEDYEVVDFSANYKIDERASVYLRIQNLLDEDYEEVGGFNAADRAAYLGTKISF